MTARAVFEALIAEPREAGTSGAARARALVMAHLEALGFEVREQPFLFQPAALNAFPLLGAGLGWLAVLLIPSLLLGHLPPFLAPATWFGGIIALALLAWGIGIGTPVAGAERREDANLIATRGSGPVRRWIVAHLDTKAQGHSLAGRIVAAWVMVVAALAGSGMALWRAVRGDALPGPAVAALGGLCVAAGFLAGRGRLRGATLGARDNGTGLLAALTAAERLPGDGVGFLFTGAEEFGLVGARVFCRLAGAPGAGGAEVINLDTITDQGSLFLVSHNPRGTELARALLPAMAPLAPATQVRHLPLGVLTDSLPFARAGWPAVTIGRLTWADLRRVHTPADTMAELSLETATGVGVVLGTLR